MKKTNLTWAALASLMLVTGVAHAQSSVTLYGLLDEGLNFTSNANGHGTYQMKSGDTYGSRWGLRGNEDLGGGLKAVFKLESGFDTNSGQAGQGGRLFGRQAYVGLSSDQYGTLTFGRQYDTSVDDLGFAGLTAAGNYAGDVNSHPFDNDNADWDFRVNNVVKYVSPTYRGLTGEAMYGFSNQAGGFANNRTWGATLNYQNGGLTMAASYLKLDNPGANSSGSVATDVLFAGSSQQDIGVAASYRFAHSLAALAYSHVDVYDPTFNAYFASQGGPSGGTWNSWKFDNFEANEQYFFRPDLWLGAAYTFTVAHLHSTSGSFTPKWHQFGLTLDYDLSKSTSVYVQGAYQHVVSAHTGTDFDFAQIPAAAGMSSSENQMVYRVAMIHRF
ncbi:porin [Paraburkholderia rhynchosiae]|uniref:Porin n=1 Tax=Paraburkholderia rhynchosiae TaxID=487049 RepID=A0A2N7WDH8_9BURK|nr:porin [Paraburkholderia rhynchosiae]PMS27433.1 porin [Paraburkholderia rhynchosiae]CAB3724597.1 Outer membrane porin protein [Paraburkholderia rhynchosiae]